MLLPCHSAVCGNLSDPLYGQVSVSGTLFGSMANYSCDTGYRVIGISTRMCGTDGTWSGEEPTINSACFNYVLHILSEEKARLTRE